MRDAKHEVRLMMNQHEGDFQVDCTTSMIDHRLMGRESTIKETPFPESLLRSRPEIRSLIFGMISNDSKEDLESGYNRTDYDRHGKYERYHAISDAQPPFERGVPPLTSCLPVQCSLTKKGVPLGSSKQAIAARIPLARHHQALATAAECTRDRPTFLLYILRSWVSFVSH